MRLTCPACEAQYDIDEALIPAAGREVECAACGHSWHQPGRSGLPFLLLDPAPSSEEIAARPAPQAPRPSAAVLDILREEAALELSQRGDDLPEEAPRQWQRAGGGRSDTIGLKDDSRTIVSHDSDDSESPPSDPVDENNPRELLPEVIVAELIDDDELPPARPSLPLPDAKAWASSLQWSPAPIAAPIATLQRSGRSAHDAGFAVAAGLSTLLLAAYIAAPHLAGAGRPGATLMEWRQSVDQGRIALYNRATPVVDGALARIEGWLR